MIQDEQKRPKVGVAVFIWRDGKFLMGRRIGKHGYGSWSVPGGHLEAGESWEEAARRETLEETGMRIKDIHFLAATNDIFPDSGKHYVSIWLEADWDSVEPAILEPDIYVEFKWATFKDLPDNLFEPCWINLRASQTRTLYVDRLRF